MLENYTAEAEPFDFKDNLFKAPEKSPINTPLGDFGSIQAHYLDPDNGIFSVIFIGDDFPDETMRNTFVNTLNGIPVDETEVHAAVRRRYFCN